MSAYELSALAALSELPDDGGESGVGAPSTVAPLLAPEGASVGAKSDGRLIVVANRLPLSIKKDADSGEYTFKMSSGGLVSALVSVRDRLRFVWIGWLGQEIPEEDHERITEQLWREHGCVPVFMSDALADPFYNGMANAELWPRFHYEDTGREAFDPSLWTAYKQANAEFAKVILRVCEPKDTIWTHDYHLMILPYLLKRHLPSTTVAWFLHTPWPSSEVFRALPVRAEILRGLLAADMLGFHVFDYARHFLSSCLRVLPDVQVTPTSVTMAGRTTRVVVYPIGIEPSAFSNIVVTDKCQARIAELSAKFAGMRVIVSVDRLDPIKGVPHRLLALETFFRTYPEFVGKVLFLQVAVPSRTDVATYMKLTQQVNQLVGSINATFGNLSYQPVHYMYRSVDPTELCALYTVGDVCLVTSLRDGMNLVSEEYIACQAHPCSIRTSPGVLVLSEFAGCAQSLAGAVRVNPWSPEDVAAGIYQALTLSDEERRLRWQRLHDYITHFTSQHWASSFVNEMQELAAASAAAPTVAAGSTGADADAAGAARVAAGAAEAGASAPVAAAGAADAEAGTAGASHLPALSDAGTGSMAINDSTLSAALKEIAAPEAIPAALTVAASAATAVALVPEGAGAAAVMGSPLAAPGAAPRPDVSEVLRRIHGELHGAKELLFVVQDPALVQAELMQQQQQRTSPIAAQAGTAPAPAEARASGQTTSDAGADPSNKLLITRRHGSSGAQPSSPGAATQTLAQSALGAATGPSLVDLGGAEARSLVVTTLDPDQVEGSFPHAWVLALRQAVIRAPLAAAASSHTASSAPVSGEAAAHQPGGAQSNRSPQADLSPPSTGAGAAVRSLAGRDADIGAAGTAGLPAAAGQSAAAPAASAPTSTARSGKVVWKALSVSLARNPVAAVAAAAGLSGERARAASVAGTAGAADVGADGAAAGDGASAGASGVPRRTSSTVHDILSSFSSNDSLNSISASHLKDALQAALRAANEDAAASAAVTGAAPAVGSPSSGAATAQSAAAGSSAAAAAAPRVPTLLADADLHALQSLRTLLARYPGVAVMDAPGGWTAHHPGSGSGPGSGNALDGVASTLQVEMERGGVVGLQVIRHHGGITVQHSARVIAAAIAHVWTAASSSGGEGHGAAGERAVVALAEHARAGQMVAAAAQLAHAALLASGEAGAPAPTGRLRCVVVSSAEAAGPAAAAVTGASAPAERSEAEKAQQAWADVATTFVLPRAAERLVLQQAGLV